MADFKAFSDSLSEIFGVAGAVFTGVGSGLTAAEMEEGGGLFAGIGSGLNAFNTTLQQQQQIATPVPDPAPPGAVPAPPAAGPVSASPSLTEGIAGLGTGAIFLIVGGLALFLIVR